MLATANFVKSVTVIDPDTKGEVELSVFKHENGGMFAIDSSYLEQCFDEEENGMGGLVAIQIPDPFFQYDRMNDLNNVELNGI